MHKGPREEIPRACIAVKCMDAILVPMLYSGYAVDAPPPGEVYALIQHIQENKIPVLLGRNANSHHIL